MSFFDDDTQSLIIERISEGKEWAYETFSLRDPKRPKFSDIIDVERKRIRDAGLKINTFCLTKDEAVRRAKIVEDTLGIPMRVFRHDKHLYRVEDLT